MNINKNEFLDVLKQVTAGLDMSGRPILEGADCVVISNGMLHSYNDSISVSAPFPAIAGIGPISVKGGDLTKLMQKLKTQDVEISAEPGLLKIRSGSVDAEITAISPSSMSESLAALPLAELQYTALPADFLSHVRLCSMPGNKTPTAGLFVCPSGLYSTDSVRMNHSTPSIPDVPTVWLPEAAATELGKLPGVTGVAVSPGWSHWQMTGGAVFSARAKDHSQFPAEQMGNLLTAAKAADGVSLEFPPGLAEAADRVAVLATEVKRELAVQLTFTGSGIQVFAKNASGKISDKVAVELPSVTSPVSVWVSAGFIAEAAGKAMNFKICSIGGTKAMAFSGDNYFQMAAILSDSMGAA